MVTEQIKKLRSKEDLIRLVAGDVVLFGVWEEPALCYDYPGLKENELFLLSRFKMTGVPGGIGVIFDHVNNLKIEKGYFNLNHFGQISVMSDKGFENLLKEKGWSYEDYGKNVQEQLPKTQDGLFHYGVNSITRKIEDEGDRGYVSENPELYDLFNKALERAEL